MQSCGSLRMLLYQSGALAESSLPCRGLPTNYLLFARMKIFQLTFRRRIAGFV